MEIYKSACRMCHGGCGVIIQVKDQKIVKITGDPESPLNNGRMCAKGLASLDHVYNPNRLKYPLKRIGKRGEGKWKRISWDEALNAIVEKIRLTREKYGIESVAIGQGTGRHHYDHVVRFANALGTPNWCEPGCAQCFIPRVLVGGMTYGGLPVCDYYGNVNPACLLVWGHNPIISGPDGEIQFKVRECLNKGTKLIVIDPRQTEMAKKADIWLQIRPGTDAALALSMINVIINEGIYDKEFVERWTYGFEKLADKVQEYTPDRVEKITWVEAEKIREAARMFANTKPAALEWGVALEQTPNCLQIVRAVALLPGITGNIDVPGGWILGMQAINPAPLLTEKLPPEMREKRLGADKYKVLCGRDAILPSANITSIFKAMQTGQPYPIKDFLIFGNNALVAYANSKEVYESLLDLELLVVMDIYMTPTAELADIVLPAATWLEVDAVVAYPYFANNVVMAQQKIVSMWECRQDEEVLTEIARRMNLESGTESLEEIYNYQLKPLGINFADLKKIGFVAAPFKYKKYEESGFFSTPSGKVELYSNELEKFGYSPLPYYEEPPESPYSQPELAREYPLILTTGGRSQYFFHSEYRQIKSLRKKHPYPAVDIHPETAQKYGIKEDSWVFIETPRGRIKQKAKLNAGIDPRVVNVEHGWWYPEEGGPEYGLWKSNANVLTSNAPPYDPSLGTYQLRSLLCKIYPAL